MFGSRGRAVINASEGSGRMPASRVAACAWRACLTTQSTRPILTSLQHKHQYTNNDLPNSYALHFWILYDSHFYVTLVKLNFANLRGSYFLGGIIFVRISKMRFVAHWPWSRVFGYMPLHPTHEKLRTALPQQPDISHNQDRNYHSHVYINRKYIKTRSHIQW